MQEKVPANIEWYCCRNSSSPGKKAATLTDREVGGENVNNGIGSDEIGDVSGLELCKPAEF